MVREKTSTDVRTAVRHRKGEMELLGRGGCGAWDADGRAVCASSSARQEEHDVPAALAAVATGQPSTPVARRRAVTFTEGHQQCEAVAVTCHISSHTPRRGLSTVDKRRPAMEPAVSQPAAPGALQQVQQVQYRHP